MDTWIIIVITFAVAFWFGSAYGKTNYKHRRKFLLRTIVTIVAVATSVLALAGLIAFVSPSLALTIFDKLPFDIQVMLLTDLLLRGGTGVWIFLIMSGILWWVRFGVLHRR